MTHGRKLYVNIKCINKVELATVEVPEPVTVIVESPEAHTAQLQFIPFLSHQSSALAFQNYDNSIPNAAIQSNQSRLQFCWTGFEDSSGVDHYEYRLTSQIDSHKDWTSTGDKTLVTVDNLELSNGETYTAEVRAVNRGNFRSEIVNATILVDNREPALTGMVITQQAHDVYTTSHPHRCNIITLHRRCCDVFIMLRDRWAVYIRHVRPVKTQISLRIRHIVNLISMNTLWIFKVPGFLWAGSSLI